MTAMTSTTALAGPALRLHLLELYLLNTDMPDQALPLAQADERWIADAEEFGDATIDPEQIAEQMVAGSVVDTPPANASEEPLGPTDVEGLAALVEAIDARAGGKPAAARTQIEETAAEHNHPAETPQVPLEGETSGPSSAMPKRGDKKATLLRLFSEGWEAAEIADHLGCAISSVTARASTYGVSAQWREARLCRRAQQAEGPAESVPDIVHIDPSADMNIPVATVVSAPLPVVGSVPTADDLAAAALVADKHPLVARDVAPGERWAFDHRTLAEVDQTAEPPRHTAAPLAKVAPEETTRAPRRFADANRKVAKHLPADVQAGKQAERALIEAALDRGMVKITKAVTPANHPGGRVPLDTVITYLRNDDVVVNINKGMWLVNGADSLSAKQLLERANKRRKRARLAPFELEK